jgi:hypothetical protein
MGFLECPPLHMDILLLGGIASTGKLAIVDIERVA